VILDREWPMTAGTTSKQADLWRGTAAVCEGRVGPRSIWAVLYREGDRLFGDELFADLFAQVGRRSVPPRIVATVMVLQRLQGLSDREAVQAFSFDARWKYAGGGLAFEDPSFSHTVLVDMRARLAASARPERIFEVTVAAARQAGLVGVRRVLDATPLYDAVATMDTVTLLGAAIRGVLTAADQALQAELRAVLASEDEYASAAKPRIDWDDHAARAALVDARARDAQAVLGVLAGRWLAPAVAQAVRLLGAVVGQDLEQGTDGSFRIARKVAADRVSSTVDPDARHGHKRSARGVDGDKRRQGARRSRPRQRAGGRHHRHHRHRGQRWRRGGRARARGRAGRPGRGRPAGAHAHRLRRQCLRQRVAAGQPARRRHCPR
jgi:hypothetical protein